MHGTSEEVSSQIREYGTQPELGFLEVYDGISEYMSVSEFMLKYMAPVRPTNDKHVFVVPKGRHDSSPVVEGEELDVAKLVLLWGPEALDKYDIIYAGKAPLYEDARTFTERVVGPTLAASTEDIPADVKMAYEHNHNQFVHARNEMIRQWIARAIRLGKDPNYDPHFLAQNTAHEIIRLFY